MARIGFIRARHMGLPMAQNLIKAGHQVEGATSRRVRPTAEKHRAARLPRRTRSRRRAPTGHHPCCRPASTSRVYLGNAASSRMRTKARC